MTRSETYDFLPAIFATVMVMPTSTGLLVQKITPRFEVLNDLCGGCIWIFLLLIACILDLDIRFGPPCFPLTFLKNVNALCDRAHPE